MNPHTRISDLGNILIIGRANTIHAQLSALAGRASMFNQQKEDPEPYYPLTKRAGESVPMLPGNFQDVDASRDDYRAGISKGVTA